MANIIAQAPTPVKAEGQMVRRPGDNAAQKFSTDMDDAVKKTGRGPVAGEKQETGGGGVNKAEADDAKMGGEMDEKVEKQGAGAGLFTPSTVVGEDAAPLQALCVDSVRAEPAPGDNEPIGLTSNKAGRNAGVEEVNIRALNGGLQEQKNMAPLDGDGPAVGSEKSGAGEKNPEGNSGEAAIKAASPEKGPAKDALITHSTAEQAVDADGGAEGPEIKSAGATETAAAQTDDFTGEGFGRPTGDEKGNHGHGLLRGDGGVAITRLSGVSATYEAVASGAELTGEERAEVYGKLSEGVRVSIAKDGGEVRLSLRPDHLGNLNIRLKMDENSVSARIIVESAVVKDALEADTVTLREVFAKNNLVLDKYTVEVAGRDFSFDRGASGFSSFNNNGSEGFLSGNNRAEVLIEENGIDAGFMAPGRVSGIDLFI